MEFQTVGKGVPRKDAAAKVTGQAQYTRDIPVPGLLYGKILRSPVAHGIVRSIDTGEAEAMPGVVRVLTPFNTTQKEFPTAGHPYSLDPSHRDRADRRILTARVRFVGDEVAAVIARDELTAEQACRRIRVEYEELPFYLDAEEALREGATEIHEGYANRIGHNSFTVGDVDIEEAFARCDHIFEDVLETPPVQHCQMENHVAYAYQAGDGRLVIVSSTQIPHIVRRVVAHVLELPMGRVRVIKPYLGGGFGNKQDVCLEPLVAAMTLAVGGRPVLVEMEREENLIATRTRHGVRFYMRTGLDSSGRILAKDLRAYGNGGAYSAHGHSIVAKIGSNFYATYPAALATRYEGTTAYTNCSVAAAMRAYGIPQIAFAVESHLDNIAESLGMDPLRLREINMMQEGFRDRISGVETRSCGLPQILERVRSKSDWERKRSGYRHQQGDRRRGLGFAMFSYPTGTWPVALEIGGANLVMNQDGTVQLQMGATEIGQGAATVFCQMAAETLGVPVDMVEFEEFTDTDFAPFDTGAYASRQCYVSGRAVRMAAEELRAKVLQRAAALRDADPETLDIVDARIVRRDTGEVLAGLADIAMDSYYNTETAEPLLARASANVRTNGIAFGGCVAEVEVDIQTGQVEILEITNIHDSGTIINPVTAAGQVHGGMSMALGYALTEVMLYDGKTGAPRNNNFLDYKIPTLVDTPELCAEFVEPYEPTAPYGNKALGEPPTIAPAPAIRNAILHATGVRVDRLPMNPQRLFESFRQAGLIREGGDGDV